MAALLLALPALATAVPRSTSVGSCPQGFLAVDRPNDAGGGPPAYEPGSTVTASGALNDRTAAPEVTLRWATEDGPVLGRAAVDADGQWRGLRFRIPPDTAEGPLRLYVEARGRDGRMVFGLPFAGTIRVGTPVAAAPMRESAERDAELRRAALRRRAARERGTAPRSTAPRAVAPAPSANAPAVSAVAATGSPVATPLAVAAAAGAPPAPRGEGTAGPAPGAVPAPPGLAPDPPARSAPAARPPAPRPAAAERDSALGTGWIVVLIAALVGGSALVVVRRPLARRRPAEERPPAAGAPGVGVTRLEPPRPPGHGVQLEAMEAELQEIIAEQRAAEVSASASAGAVEDETPVPA